MQDLEKALEEIQGIRAQMADSTEFRGFGPAIVAFTGVLALALACLQSVWQVNTIGQYIYQWIALGLICAAIIAVAVFRRSRDEHGQMANTMMIRMAERLMPAFACGAGFTVFSLLVAPQTLWMLPGVWQLCVSLGLFSAAFSLAPSVLWVAGLYFVSGFTVLALSVSAVSLSPWLMALPFLSGQLLVAYTLAASQGFFERESAND